MSSGPKLVSTVTPRMRSWLPARAATAARITEPTACTVRKRHAGLRHHRHGARHGFRNVVDLQIEEDLLALRRAVGRTISMPAAVYSSRPTL